MTRSEILPEILSIAREVFDDEDVDFDGTTLFDAIDEWDSLSHVHMVVRLEKAFAIRFQQTEMRKLVRVQDLLDLIATKANLN